MGNKRLLMVLVCSVILNIAALFFLFVILEELDSPISARQFWSEIKVTFPDEE
ncbi:hypothetical protein [Bacillus massilinigeriensis]|uniref:hypothetical protein n=1 Tax=Bacillus mediterraneensis TaxID=1805474 RepID=UPI00135663B8|nr:hypothetical protein [Bacillus mediterraneensis]